jgi:aspartate racemase
MVKKKIGLVGGLSPESTVHYYEIICREYNRQFGKLQFPELTLESLNLQDLVHRFDTNRLERCRGNLARRYFEIATSWCGVRGNSGKYSSQRLRTYT